MNIKEARRLNLEHQIAKIGSIEAFAELTSTNPQHISQIRNKVRNLGDRLAAKIEENLGLPEGSLDRPPSSSAVGESAASYITIKQVPLLSWISAGEWCHHGAKSMADAEDWYPAPKNAGNNVFALKVEGDSMTSPLGGGQKSYPAGTIIFVDPDKQPVNGSRVVAKTDSDQFTFKSYHEDAGRSYLIPLNPVFDKIEVNDKTEICGVVIGSYIPE